MHCSSTSILLTFKNIEFFKLLSIFLQVFEKIFKEQMLFNTKSYLDICPKTYVADSKIWVKNISFSRWYPHLGAIQILWKLCIFIRSYTTLQELIKRVIKLCVCVCVCVWYFLILKFESSISWQPKRIETLYWHHLKAVINCFYMVPISYLNSFYLPRYWRLEFRKQKITHTQTLYSSVFFF